MVVFLQILVKVVFVFCFITLCVALAMYIIGIIKGE